MCLALAPVSLHPGEEVVGHAAHNLDVILLLDLAVTLGLQQVANFEVIMRPDDGIVRVIALFIYTRKKILRQYIHHRINHSTIITAVPSSNDP